MEASSATPNRANAPRCRRWAWLRSTGRRLPKELISSEADVLGGVEAAPRLRAVEPGSAPSTPRASTGLQRDRTVTCDSISSCVASQSPPAAGCADALLEMSCDLLCVRTMHVSYTDGQGSRRQCSQTGYSVKIFLPMSSTDIEVTFSVVGGAAVHRVDRSQLSMPWVRDASGSLLAELFEYEAPPEHVQFFVRGPSLHSFVARVDERQRSESLLALVSRDFHCVRKLHASYTDSAGERQHFSGTGYNVSCHLPSSARDVEVTFGVVGGGPVNKIDRRDPSLPWVHDANGQRLPETFFYATCPQSVQYEIRGPAWQSYISQVHHHRARSSMSTAVPRGGTCGGLRPGEDCREAFEVAPEGVPAIGGIVDFSEPHSEYLLPPEALLFEPSSRETHMRGETDKRGKRLIFLNTPLAEFESAAMRDFRLLLAKRGVVSSPSDALPRYMETHSLRMLQTCKYDVARAADMMKWCVSERVRRLPLGEKDVLGDLRSGFIYWHGRDRQCRPCLVFRLERLGAIAHDRERAMRTVIFTLEYALRFALVPGRVENWVIIIDMQNILSLASPFHIGGLVRTAAALGDTLDKVYCGRMAWIKIVNMPGKGVFSRAVDALIPAEKKERIGFPKDAAAALRELFEPNQLEQRYGGSAPDLQPGETYPFQFFPNARGQASYPAPPVAETDTPVGDALCSTPATTSTQHYEAEDCSMHEWASLGFHEGSLWDRSFPAVEERWTRAAAACSLTPQAAASLGEVAETTAQPCRDMSQWMELMNPMALRTECTMGARCDSFGTESGDCSTSPPLSSHATVSEEASEDVSDAEEGAVARLPVSRTTLRAPARESV